MRRFFFIRLRLFLRQCRWGFLLMAAWFAFGVLGFRRWEGAGFLDAVRYSLYLSVPRGSFYDVYSFWGQCLVFGTVFSVFVLQALQSYNPQEGCRMLAKRMKDHVVVVGYSNLGELIVDELRRERHAYVLIEKEAAKVDHLIRMGEPVIVDNAKEDFTLEEAQIARARLVVMASNNVETALIVTKKTRQRNKTAKIIARCYHDDFAEILESLGADRVISSSKSAFVELSGHLRPS